jgi:hypothetical protein
MAEESISLKAFLLGDPPQAALLKCVAAATATVKTGLIDLPRLDWGDFATEIAQKLEEMFDVKLTDVLIAAWRDYEKVTECADPTKHPADETISLPLVEHAIETSLRPCLEVAIGAHPPIRIQFTITCGLELKGVILKIQDAALRAIRVGSCRAKASVKCEGATLIQRETKELELPGRIILAHGIPIDPPRADFRRNGEARGLRSEATPAPRTRVDADAELLSAMPI